jgi:hypothetical protein
MDTDPVKQAEGTMWDVFICAYGVLILDYVISGLASISLFDNAYGVKHAAICCSCSLTARSLVHSSLGDSLTRFSNLPVLHADWLHFSNLPVLHADWLHFSILPVLHADWLHRRQVFFCDHQFYICWLSNRNRTEGGREFFLVFPLQFDVSLVDSRFQLS